MVCICIVVSKQNRLLQLLVPPESYTQKLNITCGRDPINMKAKPIKKIVDSSEQIEDK